MKKVDSTKLEEVQIIRKADFALIRKIPTSCKFYAIVFYILQYVRQRKAL